VVPSVAASNEQKQA
jgi:hypothetical protein